MVDLSKGEADLQALVADSKHLDALRRSVFMSCARLHKMKHQSPGCTDRAVMVKRLATLNREALSEAQREEVAFAAAILELPEHEAIAFILNADVPQAATGVECEKTAA